MTDFDKVKTMFKGFGLDLYEEHDRDGAMCICFYENDMFRSEYAESCYWFDKDGKFLRIETFET